MSGYELSEGQTAKIAGDPMKEALRSLIERYKAQIEREDERVRQEQMEGYGASVVLGVALVERTKLAFAEDLLAELAR